MKSREGIAKNNRRLQWCEAGIVDIPLETYVKETGWGCKAQQQSPPFVCDSKLDFLVFRGSLILNCGGMKDSGLKKLEIDCLKMNYSSAHLSHLTLCYLTASSKIKWTEKVTLNAYFRQIVLVVAEKVADARQDPKVLQLRSNKGALNVFVKRRISL